MFAHLVTVVPCIGLGIAAMLLRKGSQPHRVVGRVYVGLMLLTSAITLCMPARAGGRLFLHFGFIHTFSVITLVSLPYAIYAVRTGNVRGHQISMVMTYVGAIVIAGSFTLFPGRYLHQLFFGD
ncbi:hypothetical protein CGZ80_15630 [Rhodopirellula sp. MGV]|nr:hypothetical protein CGZ80_15630 [Rhodopirellula sp. MGV]PNY35069.1 DUF2306 domain-containing protein [Rhodopirellula baltica]